MAKKVKVKNICGVEARISVEYSQGRKISGGDFTKGKNVQVMISENDDQVKEGKEVRQFGKKVKVKEKGRLQQE